MNVTGEPDEQPPDESLTSRLPVPSDRAVRVLVIVVVLLVLLGVALFGARLYVLSQNVRDQDRTNAAQDEALKEANRRLEEAGQPTVSVPATPSPEPEPGEPGEPGEEGPAGEQGPGPSQEQVRAAVALYCQSGRCDGRGPTPGQAQTAVSLYCGANGQCRGPEGNAGQDGTDGDDSEVPGPQGEQGPPPTAAQILDAVTAYCANHNCRGDQGPPGEPGQPGSVTPGSYLCPDGQYVAGFTVTASGDVHLVCQQLILPRR